MDKNNKAETSFQLLMHFILLFDTFGEKNTSEPRYPFSLLNSMYLNSV